MKNIGKHWWGHIYTLFVVNLLWIPFRAGNLRIAAKYIRNMFSISSQAFNLEGKAMSYLPFVAFAMILCLPWSTYLKKFSSRNAYKVIKGFVAVGLIILAVCAVLNADYAPYIYGNF